MQATCNPLVSQRGRKLKQGLACTWPVAILMIQDNFAIKFNKNIEKWCVARLIIIPGLRLHSKIQRKCLSNKWNHHMLIKTSMPDVTI